MTSVATEPDRRAADDAAWMRRALSAARAAAKRGEVPVGAVITLDGQHVATAANRPVAGHDPTAHAEIRALRAAGRRQANYRLSGSTLYVTLEPCAMCVGAILHARVARLVFGAYDPLAGAVVSRHLLLDEARNHQPPEWTGGVLADPCRDVLREFFRARRGDSLSSSR
ncbi:tRNA adenosine(34) deaminase TadA [Algiphilus aromaticivorans]|uniref:tRNA adenosine(34) deaminase TadA n=1 Tax=Algiphilus aromaticivorans TaxID=382454 RepID=UPI0005C16BD1|nr:tRNA adenosine(34) deaminase TadA [Algiphilus aromaticivorans]